MNFVTSHILGPEFVDTQKLIAAKSARRNAWFAEAGDVLISPVALPLKFLRHIGVTLGFDAT